MHDENKTNHKKTRRTIEIIIIIIIILLLITCCTSKYYGRIGSINNNTTVDIDDENGDKEVILNKNLHFYQDSYEMYVSDENLKLSFYGEKINLKNLTCYTSDAKIATCFIKDGVAVVIPKSKGKVNVFVESVTNGKIYRAKSRLTIKEANKYLSLSSHQGTINLNVNKYKYITYDLIGINGNVTVEVANGNIVKASVKNGILKLEGLKNGTTKVTVKVTYNGHIYTDTYEVTVVKTSSDNTLSSLTISKGKLNPEFQENVNNYYVKVDKDTNNIDVKYQKKNKKSKVSFKFNGENVDSLENLPLKSGQNKVEITVTDEKGKKNTYTVTIEKETKENKATLNDIESNVAFDKKFQADITAYNVNVPYDTDLSLKVEAGNGVKTFYKLNGQDITSLDNLPLKNGANKLEITVTDENGQSKTYTFNIFKRYRVVEIEKTEYSFRADGISSYTVGYHVYEYEAENLVKEVDYDIDDVTFTLTDFMGQVTKTKGGINLTPKLSMVGKTLDLTIKYGDSSAKSKLSFTGEKYYVEPESDKYIIDMVDGTNTGSIVLNNNFFTEPPRAVMEDGKLCLYDQFDQSKYICLDVNSNDVTLSFDSGSNSLKIDVLVKNSGNYTITGSGVVNGKVVNNFEVVIEAVTKHILTLDPNGGMLIDEANYAYEEPFEIPLGENESLALSKYNAYFVDQENCYYYKLKEFNTLPDGTGESYALDKVVKLTNSLKLYAIYDKEDKTTDVVVKKKIYLVLEENENIFYSDFYKTKMIYPGIHGTYSIKINKEIANNFVITGITLEEESVCVPEGCLNMGYKVKNGSDVLLDDNGNYAILNKTNGLKEVTFSNPIAFTGTELNLDLLWEWVEENDHLDTLIGEKAYDEQDLIYTLTVSLDLEIKNPTCEIGERP